MSSFIAVINSVIVVDVDVDDDYDYDDAAVVVVAVAVAVAVAVVVVFFFFFLVVVVSELAGRSLVPLTNPAPVGRFHPLRRPIATRTLLVAMNSASSKLSRSEVAGIRIRTRTRTRD